ncbi:MAG: hypothetical protein K8L99_20340 [Anaerolineae bacterium]|nr:hypothetical protein [Anaerolineae bacterium]
MTVVDWNALNAAEVPQWLVALSSKDAQRQFRARMKLARYLQQHALALSIADYAYNQVLETDAPVLITSLLLEMLKDVSVANPLYVTELLEIVSTYFREPTLGQAQRERAIRIHELLLQEFDLYLEMLKFPDAGVRVYIMDLLRHIPEKQEEIANALMQHLKTTSISDELEKLTIIMLLFDTIQAETFNVDRLKKDFIGVLNQYLEQKETSTVELAYAAYYLIVLQKDQMAQTAMDTLVDILKKVNLTDPGSDLGLSDLWVDALLAYGTDQATHHSLDIFEHQTDDYVLIRVAAFLLELHFGSGDIHNIYLNMSRDNDKSQVFVSLDETRRSTSIPPVQPFSDLQKDILRQFVYKDRLWDIKTNLFELYSLPTTQSEMRKMI